MRKIEREAREILKEYVDLEQDESCDCFQCKMDIARTNNFFATFNLKEAMKRQAMEKLADDFFGARFGEPELTLEAIAEVITYSFSKKEINYLIKEMNEINENS